MVMCALDKALITRRSMKYLLLRGVQLGESDGSGMNLVIVGSLNVGHVRQPGFTGVNWHGSFRESTVGT